MAAPAAITLTFAAKTFNEALERKLQTWYTEGQTGTAWECTRVLFLTVVNRLQEAAACQRVREPLC